MSDDHCPTPKKHPKHLCKLKKKGKTDELAARSNAPTTTCDKCGAQGNIAEDVCHPHK
jgi:hypothetical protein